MQTQTSYQAEYLAIFPNSKAIHEQSENELIEAAKLGSVVAFEALVQKHEARVFRLAKNIARQQTDAEEITQNTFVQAFKKLSRFRGDCGFYTWLARITINEALMKVRRRRPNYVSVDELSENHQNFQPREIEDWGPTPEQRYSQKELQRILTTTIGMLPIGYRTVFQLRDVEGFATEETAQLLGITISSVKTRLRRARCQLRELLNLYFKASASRRKARLCPDSPAPIRNLANNAQTRSDA